MVSFLFLIYMFSFSFNVNVFYNSITIETAPVFITLSQVGHIGQHSGWPHHGPVTYPECTMLLTWWQLAQTPSPPPTLNRMSGYRRIKCEQDVQSKAGHSYVHVFDLTIHAVNNAYSNEYWLTRVLRSFDTLVVCTIFFTSRKNYATRTWAAISTWTQEALM